MRKALKYLSRMIITIFFSGCAGAILLFIVYLLPTAPMKANVQRGTVVYNTEGAIPQFVDGYANTKNDNETDAIMLSNAIYPVSNPIVDSLSVPSIDIKGDSNRTTSLLDYVNNVKENAQEISTYPRYWHGYLTILKPLLLFFDFSDIRILNMSLQLFLVILLTADFMTYGLKNYLPSYYAFLLVINPVLTSFSFQVTDCFIITMLAMHFLFQKEKKILNNFFPYILFFMQIGIVVSYFDFLTYPLVTLGVPLCLLIILQADQITHLRKIRNIISLSIAWLIGYLGMWAMKWLIGSIVIRKNIFMDALEQILLRTNTNDEGISFSRLSAITVNVMDFAKWTYLFIGIAIFICIIILGKSSCKKGIYSRKTKDQFLQIVPYVIICLYPLLWYFLASNHSYEHPRLAFREFSIFAFSACAGLSEFNHIRRQYK